MCNCFSGVSFARGLLAIARYRLIQCRHHTALERRRRSCRSQAKPNQQRSLQHGLRGGLETSHVCQKLLERCHSDSECVAEPRA